MKTESVFVVYTTVSSASRIGLSSRTFCDNGNTLYLCCPIQQLLDTWVTDALKCVATVTEKLQCSFNVNLNSNKHTGLVTTVMNSLVIVVV